MTLTPSYHDKARCMAACVVQLTPFSSDAHGVGIGTARPRLLSLGGSLLLTGSRILTSNDSDYYLWHRWVGDTYLTY